MTKAMKGSSGSPSLSSVISAVEGRPIAVRGDNIDTDRIIPARYLRCVTFEGLGEHAFEDDRRGMKEKGQVHTFDDPRHRGATILVVNKNFGCGSSREHAPQSLAKWGIRAIVGESFAEIFFGNCVSIGIPCLTADHDVVEALAGFSEGHPTEKATVDLKTGEAVFGGRRVKLSMPPGPREAFLKGIWDVQEMLVQSYAEVEAVANRLPYVKGY
jgi:3-isopropylmalate/(R)-2-methylmalate dehydratase small subunit